MVKYLTLLIFLITPVSVFSQNESLFQLSSSDSLVRLEGLDNVDYNIFNTHKSTRNFNYNEDFVNCFYSHEEVNPINIYDSIGGDIIAELDTINKKFCWCKFAISESVNGWFKIENLIICIGCKSHPLNANPEKYKGKWIFDNTLKIRLTDLPDINYDSINGVKFYEAPSEKSTIVYRSGKFLEMDLVDVEGTWAKVEFVENGITIQGWLRKEDQCSFPWTTCP